MLHLDSFSGLGLFAVAARYVWKEEYQCHGFIRALGNAIVPQVVVPIMEAIKEGNQKQGV